MTTHVTNMKRQLMIATPVQTKFQPLQHHHTTTTTTTAKTADLDYFCATEGQICNCDGKVKYGRDETWTAERDVKGSINCTNDVFGDPKLFLQKECRCTPTGDWILVEKKKECSDSQRVQHGHIGRVGEISQCA